MRAVLVTGARGGIGGALCTAFHQAGFRVVATDLEGPSPLNSDAFVAVDLEAIVQDPNALESFVKNIHKGCGEAKLSVLVNNAAIQVLGSLPNVNTLDWERSFRINVTAPFILVREFLHDLISAEGTVINIGSVHANATKQSFIAYASTKAALHGLTRALAVDLGEKLRVVTLAPAAIATPMLRAGFEGRSEAYKALADAHPAKRIGQPDEVAAAAVLLAQEPFLFSTGSVFWLDGGVLSRLHDPA